MVDRKKICPFILRGHPNRDRECVYFGTMKLEYGSVMMLDYCIHPKNVEIYQKTGSRLISCDCQLKNDNLSEKLLKMEEK